MSVSPCSECKVKVCAGSAALRCATWLDWYEESEEEEED